MWGRKRLISASSHSIFQFSQVGEKHASVRQREGWVREISTVGVNSVWTVKKTSGFVFARCLFETDSSGVTKLAEMVDGVPVL